MRTVKRRERRAPGAERGRLARSAGGVAGRVRKIENAANRDGARSLHAVSGRGRPRAGKERGVYAAGAWRAKGAFGLRRRRLAGGRFCGLNRLCENVAAEVTRRRQLPPPAPESASSRRRLPRALGVFTQSVKAARRGAIENNTAGLGAQFCQTRRAHGSHEPQQMIDRPTALSSGRGARPTCRAPPQNRHRTPPVNPITWFRSSRAVWPFTPWLVEPKCW